MLVTYQHSWCSGRYTNKYPMMRFVYRIINLFRGRKPHKPAALSTAGKEDYERWLGI